jgi:hypothetical protein
MATPQSGREADVPGDEGSSATKNATYLVSSWRSHHQPL